MIRRRFLAAVMLLVAGCATAPHRESPTTELAASTSKSVQQLASEIAADAARSDRESDSKIRDELAAAANRDADACVAKDPQSAACLYGRAVALGLDARAHPTRAGEQLSAMLDCLTAAENADPNYDEAGPARVRALVLVRAPGWPLGPGDAEAGLVAARRAAALRPGYPPNLLALAETRAKTGDPNGARQTYQMARAAAERLPDSADRDGWLRQADEALKRP